MSCFEDLYFQAGKIAQWSKRMPGNPSAGEAKTADRQ